MMEPKTQDDNSSYSWTSQKGLLTLGSFVAIALICEFFIVNFFAGSGLAELSTDILAAGLLYAVLPAVVIIVLVYSWVHLTKHVVLGPRVTHSRKTSKPQRRHSRRKTQKSFTQSTFGSIKNVFSKIGSAFSGSGTDSATPGRLPFSRAALESTLTVMTIFLLSLFLLTVLVYPRLFTDFATGFYSTNTPLQGFLKGLADALVPIASGLNSMAPGFRDFFGGLASVSAQSLTETDILIVYVLCQTAAVCISAVSAIMYVKYYCRSPIKLTK